MFEYHNVPSIDIENTVAKCSERDSRAISGVTQVNLEKGDVVDNRGRDVNNNEQHCCCEQQECAKVVDESSKTHCDDGLYC